MATESVSSLASLGERWSQRSPFEPTSSPPPRRRASPPKLIQRRGLPSSFIWTIFAIGLLRTTPTHRDPPASWTRRTSDLCKNCWLSANPLAPAPARKMTPGSFSDPCGSAGVSTSAVSSVGSRCTLTHSSSMRSSRDPRVRSTSSTFPIRSMSVSHVLRPSPATLPLVPSVAPVPFAAPVPSTVLVPSAAPLAWA